VLSQAELDWVASACDADSAFLRCWTRKEALAKLEGTGLHESLTGLTLTPQCLLPGVEIVDLPHPASGALALALRTGG
jgi:phosphopantetheinyl transferase